MAIKRLVTPNRWIGLSTDTKPTQATESRVRDGDTFYEYDKKRWYITYDGTNWVLKVDPASGSLNKVSVTKVLIGGAYSAEDVLSEATTNGLGTAWIFTSLVADNGSSGYIVRAQVISETTNVTPRLTMFLFNALPTSELDDNAANTALLHADLANYVGRIDFPALEDIGGDSMALCTPSTYGNLPLAFTCGTASTTLWGVLVTRDIFTQGAGDDMTVILQVEQY